MTRIWLAVPYSDKDAAKALGARWDPNARSWYVTDPQSPALARWARANRDPLPDPLPEEDRTFGGSTLFVDLVPRTGWFTNVRSAVAPADWDRLRHYVYQRAGRRCEVCGAAGRLEAHERWAYDEARGIQTLRRLISLCNACHTATHFGLAEKCGQRAAAMAQLMHVNRWTQDQAEAHVDQAFATWERRNQQDWALDLRMLTQVGIAVRAPAAEDRPGLAAEQLAARAPTMLSSDDDA
jgi:hypothetical protein